MPDRATMTRAELCGKLHKEMGLTKADCSRLVDEVLNEIAGALERGESVKLSNFGTFLVRAKAPRTGRNPKTGEAVPITPRRVLTFRPSQHLRARATALTAPAGDDATR